MNGTLEKLSRELSLVCGGARMHAVEASLYVCVCVCVCTQTVQACEYVSLHALAGKHVRTAVAI